MEKLINFYDCYKKELLEYDKIYIDKLFSIIDEFKNYNDEKWLLDANNIIYDCFNIVPNIYLNYSYYSQKYVKTIKMLLSNEHSQNIKHYKITYKLNTILQMFNFIDHSLFNEKIFFDKSKYSITIDTYSIFLKLKKNIIECNIEWNTAGNMFFYSKTDEYINICIYTTDDFFGHKLFLTYRKNINNNHINIILYDDLIISEENFYNKLNGPIIWLISLNPEIHLTNSLNFIDIEQIAKCFELNNDKNNINIELNESKYISIDGVLKFISDFLDN